MQSIINILDCMCMCFVGHRYLIQKLAKTSVAFSVGLKIHQLPYSHFLFFGTVFLFKLSPGIGTSKRGLDQGCQT